MLPSRPLAALGVAAAVSCSSAADPDGPIPPEPDASTTSSANVETFAVHAVFLGESFRDGGLGNTKTWQEYGYDLDRHTTTPSSTDVCTLFGAASTSVQVDGDEGTDNSWGANLLPIVQTASAINDPSSRASAQIVAGKGTFEIQVTGLSDDPHQTATGLSAQIFIGASNDNPVFALGSDWPVTPSSVKDGVSVASGAVVRFDTVYVTDGTVVATGASAPLTIPTVFFGVIPIVIHHPIVTFKHPDADSASDGVVAGVIDTEELISWLHMVAGLVSPSLCGSAFDGIADQIRQEQDILSDGTNTRGVPCDGISAGVGFEAMRIGNPTRVGAEVPWLTNPCDAGAD